MIVREREKHFVMIEQHHHAQLAGKLFLQLHDEFLPSKQWREDIFYAIFEHDCGWIHFDEVPFWNDGKTFLMILMNFRSVRKLFYMNMALIK